MSDSSYNILYVEDNQGDVVLLQHALKVAGFNPTLNVVRDGVEAMDFLNQREKYSNVSVPDLVLLDLNLPKKNGYEVLKETKQDPRFLEMTVIILTSSKNPKDKEQCMDLNASHYFVKPTDFNEWVEFVNFLKSLAVSIVLK
jgi:chemotaxis family two-component system response regulator Rcp1